jgi:hypothetical protein
MNEVKPYNNEAFLTLFKAIREMNKWYHKDLMSIPTFKSTPVRGLWTVWRPTGTGYQILLDTDHRTYAMLEWNFKSQELFIQDLKLTISEAMVDQNEIQEHLLLAVVRIYAEIKEKIACTGVEN